MVIVAAGIHVLCGLAAIIAAVTAMLARKGSRRHRRAGRVWLVGLAGLCSGAVVLASLDWRTVGTSLYWPQRRAGWQLSACSALAGQGRGGGQRTSPA